MRVWDVPVGCLCRNHLLAEHRELHAIWNIILYDRRGYSRHPEVSRWRGKLGALWKRHEEEVNELLRRGYRHHSPLDQEEIPRAHRGSVQKVLLEPASSQKKKLRGKGCSCDVRR
jgi:hypothetical protein